MTRDYANELLYLWKVGAQVYPPHVITQALYVTGDLDGPHLESEPRLVRVPGAPAWMESLHLGSGADDGEAGTKSVLATAGATSQGDSK